MKKPFTIVSFLFLLFVTCSCEKDTIVKDEYTGKKMVSFVEQRAVMAAPSIFLDVSFEKDTIVLFNEEYAMPIVDKLLNDVNDTIEHFKRYIQPNMQKFRFQVYYEMFGYSTLPGNEINIAFLKATMKNPSGTYGNMVIKVIHNFYVKSNGDYIEKQIVLYYDAEYDNINIF
jgi:hypothetical protein